MLKVDDLQKQIKAALSTYIPQAIETCLKNKIGHKGKHGYQLCEEFAKTFDEMVSEPLAESLANAIDYYIKTASVSGTVITSGSAVTQQAQIRPAPSQLSAGIMPNTFKIS